MARHDPRHSNGSSKEAQSRLIEILYADQGIIESLDALQRGGHKTGFTKGFPTKELLPILVSRDIAI